jgi:general secretion pathway protein G
MGRDDRFSPLVPPRDRARHRADSAGAFSVIELVIVIVIMGAVATIAVPRLIGASQRASAAALSGDTKALQRAIDFYIAEHGEFCPAAGSDGTISTDGNAFANRLTSRTDDDGSINATGPNGPYLTSIPINPYNAKNTIRVDGVDAGSNAGGWRYDSIKRIIEPDHTGIDIDLGGSVDGGAGGAGAGGTDAGGGGGSGSVSVGGKTVVSGGVGGGTK